MRPQARTVLQGTAWLSLLAALAVGCATDAGEDGTGASKPTGEVAEPPGDRLGDAPKDEASDPAQGSALLPCTASVSGDAPFGVTLRAEVGERINAPEHPVVRPHEKTFQLYFPQGRRAGAPVVFAPIGDEVLRVQRTRLGDDLSTTLGTYGFSGQLLGPDQGALGTLTFVHAEGDFGWADSYQGVLCPAGDVPAPTLQQRTREILPLDHVELELNVPPDRESLALLNIDGRSVTTTELTRLELMSPTGAWAPGRHTIGAADLRDVLGRPYTSTDDFVFDVAQPTAIADLSFETPLPPGAVAGPGRACVAVVDGSLVCDAAHDVAAIIGLGDLPGSGPLRVRHGLAADPAIREGRATLETWLISSDGVAVQVPLPRTSTEVSVELRGRAPFYWLLRTAPNWFGFLPNERYSLEALQR